MCGIFGAIDLNKSFTQNELDTFNESLKIISHRGPDATDHIVLSSKNCTNNVFLGHNRLSIIDLSDVGTQPFTNDGENYIIFNGEIYNYLELKEKYLNNENFISGTDTEVILNLYKKFGVDIFKEMNGMWSFIIFDIKKDLYIVSRDRFSIKPMYHYEKSGVHYFSSEIKQLIKFLPKVEVNKDVPGNYLFNYIIDYDEQTFFKDIKKLPSKAVMIIDISAKRCDLSQYWDYSYQDFGQRKAADLEEEFRELFTDAIKIRLRSDVKVGNTLSGGLDSSSIAVIANKISKEPLTNLSVINKHKEFSEEKFVDLLIQRNNLNVKKINVDDQNLWNNIEKVIWHNDEPILSLSTAAHFAMMKQFKEQTDITVILSGQGGDETLAGYNKYFYYNLKNLLSTKKYATFVKEGLYMLPKFLGEIQLKHANRYLNPKYKSKTFIDAVVNLPFENKFIDTSSSLFERQISDINRFSVPALTHYEDRSSMSQALEIRLPFLDYRMVNFNLNLPIEYKINNGFSKYILRKSINELPNELAWRKDKKGFTIDENSYYTSNIIKYIQSLFDGNSELSKLSFIRDSTFTNEFNAFIAGKTNYWVRDVNRIVFTEIWLRTFFR